MEDKTYSQKLRLFLLPALLLLKSPVPLAAFVLLSFAGVRGAQGRGQIERFSPAASMDGLLGTDGPDVVAPRQLSIGMMLRLANNPLVWRYDDDTYDPVISSRLTADLAARIGVFRLLDLGLVLPVVLRQEGPPSEELGDLRGGGLGDIRLIPRITMLPKRIFGIGLGMTTELTLPTGNGNRLLGGAGPSLTPRISASTDIGPITLLASLGYQLRKNTTIVDLKLDDEMQLHVGGEMPVASDALPMTMLVELRTATSVTRPLSSGDVTASEVIVGLRMRLDGPFVAQTGIAGGFSQGVGTPMFRVLFGLVYAPEALDSDSDGIPDSADACPLVAEDYDHYADLDGCPDENNDTVVDDPMEVEAESVDALPDRTRDSDSDGDGKPDGSDLCPDDPEDRDGFEDEDGCPEYDNDRDGVRDSQDLCPEDPETINGVDDYDGCPDEGEGVAQVREQGIEIRETILFEIGNAKIKPVSTTILDQVALQILAHPNIRFLRIEGHTDNVGEAAGNLLLSQARAESVRAYLIERGVEPHRVEAIGYGESRPIADNTTDHGRTLNRRVEFVILEKNE